MIWKRICSILRATAVISALVQYFVFKQTLSHKIISSITQIPNNQSSVAVINLFLPSHKLPHHQPSSASLFLAKYTNSKVSLNSQVIPIQYFKSMEHKGWENAGAMH